MADWEGAASNLQCCVPWVRPWKWRCSTPIPSTHCGAQRASGGRNDFRSFLEILSSYCVRKKNQCPNREVSPSPSGREGSFRSCFCPRPLLYSLPRLGMLLLTPFSYLGMSWHTNVLLISLNLILELPCRETKWQVRGRVGKCCISRNYI